MMTFAISNRIVANNSNAVLLFAVGRIVGGAVPRDVSGAGGLPIGARQACDRPIARDWLPLIGKMPGVTGAYIDWAPRLGHPERAGDQPGVGREIADGVATTVDLAPFDPDQLPPLDHAYAAWLACRRCGPKSFYQARERAALRGAEHAILRCLCQPRFGITGHNPSSPHEF